MNVNVNEMVSRKLGRAAESEFQIRPAGTSGPTKLEAQRILNTARRDVGPYLNWES